MRRNPLVPVALALIVGIAGQHWLPAVDTTVWLILALGAALTSSLLLILRRRMHLSPTLILLLLSVAGIGGMLGRRSDPQYNPHDWTHLSGQKAFIAVRLTETPQPRTRSWSAKARVESVDGQTSEGDIRLFLKQDTAATALHYGDRLLIHGYPDLAKRTLYTTSDHYIVTSRDSTSLRSRCERLRMRLLQRMQQGPLTEREAGLAAAMTLGWRADMDPDTQATFRDAGIAHLLAVSGLHVGLVATIASLLCFWIPKERRGRIARGILTLAAVWGFAMITGMKPSTMRAALMFSLFIVSNIGERDTPPMNLLAATALLTLTAHPMLLFDVGWQMSYAAVAGILLARPLIGLYHNRIWDAATVSLAATAATLPITTATFHTIQPYFLIANVVIIPLAGVILALSLTYMAIPCVATAWPLEWVLKGTEWLTAKVSALPGAVIELAPTAGWVTATIAAAVAILLISENYAMRRVNPQAG